MFALSFGSSLCSLAAFFVTHGLLNGHLFSSRLVDSVVGTQWMFFREWMSQSNAVKSCSGVNGKGPWSAHCSRFLKAPVGHINVDVFPGNLRGETRSAANDSTGYILRMWWNVLGSNLWTQQLRCWLRFGDEDNVFICVYMEIMKTLTNW